MDNHDSLRECSICMSNGMSNNMSNYEYVYRTILECSIWMSNGMSNNMSNHEYVYIQDWIYMIMRMNM